MDLGLTSKRALITGSTAGIGYATAEALARKGVFVIINGRTPARVQAAIAQIKKSVPGAHVDGIAADVSTAQGCAEVIAAHSTAQIAVARGLAETLAGTGVTVNSVLPGPTASEGVGTFVAQLASEQGADKAAVERDFFATARPSSILQRFMQPAEIAAMIAYVCSAQASATTGAALRVVRAII